jgi:hypothetical protein
VRVEPPTRLYRVGKGTAKAIGISRLRLNLTGGLDRLNSGRLSDRTASGPNNRTISEGSVRVRITTDGRLLGFDLGDWALLAAGFAVAGLLVLLV